MRTINIELLASWIAINGPLAKEELAYKSRIGFHTIIRILRGDKVPTDLQQTAICKATGISRNDLFPLVEKKKETA